MARAFGSYPKCHWFKSSYRYPYGPVVKRLRHRPFTAVTRVRFSSGSPESAGSQVARAFLFLLPTEFLEGISHDEKIDGGLWRAGPGADPYRLRSTSSSCPPCLWKPLPRPPAYRRPLAWETCGSQETAEPQEVADTDFEDSLTGLCDFLEANSAVTGDPTRWPMRP